jgi:histidinol-phosphate phosphatase family protein
LTDNVSELTARTNDEGWETVFVEWLKTSRLKASNALFIFSVGGGDLEKNVSPNLVRALQYAKEIGAKVLGVVGRDWRLHGESRRRRFDCPDGQSGCHHTSFGSISGGNLVSARHASASQDRADEMGRGTLTVEPAKPAVFLDRDGVLNEPIFHNGKPYPPRDLTELVITRGADAALEKLKRQGFLLIVVTDQPDVARGKANRADIDKINARLAAILPLDAIEVCEHDDKEQCDCRKPNPSMILRAREKFGVDLAAASWCVIVGAISRLVDGLVVAPF